MIRTKLNRQVVKEWVEYLGLPESSVKQLVIDPAKVTIEVLVRDINGRPILIEDDILTTEVRIKLV